MKNFEIFFQQTYLFPAYSKYQEYQFSKLISDYSKIEADIIYDIKAITNYFFIFNNYAFKGRRYYNGNVNFTCVTDFTESNRELSIFLKDEKSINTKSLKIDIEHFGIIRRVVIITPDYLEKICYPLLLTLEKYINACYNSIETAIKQKFAHVADQICQKINKILCNYLLSINKKHIVESTRFFIFQKNAGFFYFDKESYSQVIENFKKNQNDILSPYELAVWLLTNPLPFAKSLTIKSFIKDGKYVWQEWDKAEFRDEELFFEAARSLYELKPYAVLSICKSKNDLFSLSIAFKKTDKRELVPELQKIKHIIIEEFNDATSKYSNYIHKFELLKVDRALHTFPEIIGDFTGSTIAAFIKIMYHMH